MDMFEPWIGSNFGNPANSLKGARLLVLGDSHHGEAHQIETAPSRDTIQEIEEHLERKRGKRRAFWTIIAQAVAGRSGLSDDELRLYWSEIAFCNYIPVYAARGPREERLPHFYAKGGETFPTYLAKIRPDAIVVLGQVLWDNAGFEKVCGTNAPMRLFDIPVAIIRHPAGGFSTPQWAPAVAELVSRVTGQSVKSA